jgi:hypothetical protein
MRFIVLAVLLAVMQAAPPVPRKAPDNPAQATTNIKTQSKSRQTPSSPSPATAETSGNWPAKTDGSEESQKYTEHPIVISKLPAVALDTPKRDWADWGTWGFNFLLVAVGGLQVWLLFRTWKTVRRQADWMRRQTVILSNYNRATREAADSAAKSAAATESTVELLNKQAAEMNKQTQHLEGSVAAAQMSANAAKLSADIAARVSIPNLVIEKFEHVDTAAKLADMLRSPRVNVVIRNYGQTPALLKFWTIIFTCGDLPAIPAYWNHLGSGIILERTSVETNESYTLPDVPNWRIDELSVEDVQAIIDHKKTLWVYGFICYDDIFGSRRRLKFCEFALNIREGWIQWERDICPPIYQGIEEFPWGLAPNEGKKAENPNEAEQPN